MGQGFLVAADPLAARLRSVRLAPPYEELAAEVRKEAERYKHLLR